VTTKDWIIRVLTSWMPPLSPPPRTMVKFKALPRTPRTQELRAAASQK
jgi:hypothetical protein